MFHLLVVKTPVTDNEVEYLAEQIDYYDPPFVTIRRLQEAVQGKENSIQELRQALATRDVELAELGTVREMAHTRETQLEQAHSELARARGQVQESAAEAEALRQALATRDMELVELKSVRERARAREVELEEAQAALKAEANVLRHTLATQKAEMNHLQGSLAAAQTGLEQLRASLTATERKLALWQDQGRATSAELAGLRRRRVLRIADRFRPGPDLSPQIDPAFQNLLDDSYLFLGALRRFRLQPSENLQSRRPLEYALQLDRPNLSGVMLAPIVDLPDETGSLGIELATPDGLTIASARVSLSEIELHRPVRFVFPPLPSSRGTIVLRVDVRDAATPVRLFEWRKRRFLGLGRLATRPFCAFIFE
jgi:hypothetical protein